MAKNEMLLEPPKITLLSFFLKVLSGIVAGVLGSVLLTAIFLLTSSLFNPVLIGDKENIHPLFIFLLMATVFLTMLAANLSGPLFLSFADEDRYRKISSALYQIFILNLIIFIFTVPLYLIAVRIDFFLIVYVAFLQIILSAMASIMALRIISTPAYSILGVYTSIFAVLASLAIIFLIVKITGHNMMMLMFSVVPVIWFCIGFFEATMGAIYYGIYSFYGEDFINRETEYGEDIGGGKAEQLDEELSSEQIEEYNMAQKKDETGAEFLERKGKRR